MSKTKQSHHNLSLIRELQTEIIGWNWQLQTATNTKDKRQARQRLYELEFQYEKLNDSK